MGREMAISHISLDSISDDHPVKVFAFYWHSLESGENAPRWNTFDIIACARVVPWILLLKPNGDGGLYYAISGGGCDEVCGFRYQGKTFGEGLPAKAAEDRRREFEDVVRKRKPLYSKVSLPIEDKGFIEVYRGVFPFLDEDGTLEALVVVLSPVTERV